MTKPTKSVPMGAAECARRTGLTIRALRVYERHGLIDPRRTGKGWRCYGPAELQRLNIIVTLKAFGMTLEQIRTLLVARTPPLASVLQMQLRACHARRDAVEKALALVQTALSAIGSGRALSLDELCKLTRSMDMGTEMEKGDRFKLARGLINEKITPEEERAFMNWMAARPSGELQATLESAPARQALLRALRELQIKTIDPEAPEVQALIAQLKDLGGRGGDRDRGAALYEWNPTLARKWAEVGEHVLSRRIAVEQEAVTDGEFTDYLRAAREASPWSKALEKVTDEAAKLVEANVQPASQAARALASRLAIICSEYSLGDPLVYARWAPMSLFRKRARERARSTGAWAFLAAALKAAALGTS